VQAYNNRLAQMPNLGVQAMIDEMKRCQQLGFRSVIISTWPSGEDDLSEQDDPFFAAAQELGMPVSIHIPARTFGRTSAAPSSRTRSA